MAASNETIHISVYGRQEKFPLRTKLDKTLPKSIITKEKAELTKGKTEVLSAPMEFKDSAGIMHLTKSWITLRYQYGRNPQTFDEIFYIVDSCEFDAMFRRDIPREHLKDERSCLPLIHRSNTQEESKDQAAATQLAKERNKKEKDDDKTRDWQNQPPLKKKDK